MNYLLFYFYLATFGLAVTGWFYYRGRRRAALAAAVTLAIALGIVYGILSAR